jgi:uncharacterized membrane protein YdbT with pleckstrin-like domain
VVYTQRHWAVLFGPAVRGVPALAVGAWVLQVDPTNRVSSTIGLLIVLGALLYLLLHVAEWWVRHLLVTRRRVLLTSGVIIRTVAVMPLRRITDLTWKETLFGQLLGYGTFRFESAGQQQGLDVITYVPNAAAIYRELSQLMFPADYAKDPRGDGDDDGTGSTEDGESARQRPRPRAAPPPPGHRDTAPIRPVPPQQRVPPQQPIPPQQRPPPPTTPPPGAGNG